MPRYGDKKKGNKWKLSKQSKGCKAMCWDQDLKTSVTTVGKGSNF